ncbi:hypothetical protein H8356DRAFT_1317294 [Neocallimastix lanati (nom. inval.)]|uniref:LysM domain-containing protein n=1 Tax=Neocallimastix californiae TaxID=1754190 RepID=A0A1Y2CG64_9FUNG|nr:hypothetical protein H8356DRAFT_1317294 [Neocallimastix sp. JGI-2020a]ORY45814.1 hypothetical protein LY90DRAFT_671473 [Neocallimastix californiae]|eukprot:ORY45814.1 hypothetical protein LY90DRAFT_671473 [Neocallimastix californiae]
MKFNYITILFTLLLVSTKVFGLGYHCSKHVVIKHGDRCKDMTNGFSEDKDYYITSVDLYRFNPTLNCSNLKRGQKVCVEVNPDYYDKDNNYESLIIEKKYKSCENLASKLKTTLTILKNVNPDVKFICSNFKKMTGEIINYRKDGKYTTIFKNSKRVNIK